MRGNHTDRGTSRWRSAAIVIGVAGVVAALSAPGVAQALPTGGASKVPAISADRALPRFMPTAATNAAANTLAGMVSRGRDRFTGVIVTGKKSVTVTLPAGAGLATREAAARAAVTSAAATGGVAVRFQTVARSEAAIDAIKAQLEPILASHVYKGQFVGIGEDPSLGVAVVYVSARSNQVRANLAKRFGDAVIFRLLDGSLLPQDLDRSRDSVPHYGGSGILLWNSAHTDDGGICSTSFAINVDSVTYMLTAGHCLPGQSPWTNLWASGFTSTTPPSSAFYFGTLHTTTANGTDPDNVTGGTQNKFGDWALIRSSTYSPHIYSCANVTGTCTTFKVGAASYTAPPIGAGACTSAAVSGEICRYSVTDSDIIYSSVSLPYVIAHVSLLEHDSNLDGIPDCDLTQPGDSGGAVFQGISGRTGYVRAMGVVHGIRFNRLNPGDTTECRVVYTELAGVRAFNSGATVVTAP